MHNDASSALAINVYSAAAVSKHCVLHASRSTSKAIVLMHALSPRGAVIAMSPAERHARDDVLVLSLGILQHTRSVQSLLLVNRGRCTVLRSLLLGLLCA